MNQTPIELFEAAENAAIVGDIMTRVMLTCELGSITRKALNKERLYWYERATHLLDQSLYGQTSDGATLVTYGTPTN